MESAACDHPLRIRSWRMEAKDVLFPIYLHVVGILRLNRKPAPESERFAKFRGPSSEALAGAVTAGPG